MKNYIFFIHFFHYIPLLPVDDKLKNFYQKKRKRFPSLDKNHDGN